LISALERAGASFFAATENALVTRERHRRLLIETVASLTRTASTRLDSSDGGKSYELVAEDLRLAARSLGRLTGRVDVDDILDVIFRDFCIGK
jgi:tRNA modification GTPase